MYLLKKLKNVILWISLGQYDFQILKVLFLLLLLTTQFHSAKIDFVSLVGQSNADIIKSMKLNQRKMKLLFIQCASF